MAETVNGQSSGTDEPHPPAFSTFAKTCDGIRSTRSKLKKIDILSKYISSLSDETGLKIATTFLSGRIFPPGETNQEVNVGYSLLWKALSDMFNLTGSELSTYYKRYGDLGDAAAEIFEIKKPVQMQRTLLAEPGASLSLNDVYLTFKEISKTRGANSIERKLQILKRLLSDLWKPDEARYIVKILTTEMRIGLVEGLVEEALAKSFGKSLDEIRTANLIVGNIGLVAVLAKRGKLSESKLEPHRPTNFMLAETAEDANDLYSKFETMPVLSEFKYDGIRAQVHLGDKVVRIFSRNLADITHFFPEIETSFLATKEKTLIVDGEIVAFKDGNPLSFQLLQRRLRKKKISDKDSPVRYFAFDLLYHNKSSLISRPVGERVRILRSIDFPGVVSFSEQREVSSPAEITAMFDESRSLGFEGLVVKDPSSPYSPGRRGKSWVKLKKELDTLDVVVVAAEYGHGKRAGVISDYTFAVRDRSELKVVGKAYSGLTDAEILQMTDLLKSITLQDFGYRRTVKPHVVMEVAFDAIQRSDRHDSGFALRFPRIKRLRLDKSITEIDSLERVRGIYEAQRVKV